MTLNVVVTEVFDERISGVDAADGSADATTPYSRSYKTRSRSTVRGKQVIGTRECDDGHFRF
jgi:hypothetical protein